MIIYDKSFWGIILLGRMYGSAFPRALPIAASTAVFTGLLGHYVRDDIRKWWLNPYPHQTIFFVVGFIIVFRCNLSYNRYWEGRTSLQTMTARWMDATIEFLSFDQTEDDRREPGSDNFSRLYKHLMSLLHACCCQTLRRDPDMGNLIAHYKFAPAPPQDPAYYNRDSAMANPEHISITAVGQAKLIDYIMLRAAPTHLQQYNAAFPLPVINGLSSEELSRLACSCKFSPQCKRFRQSLDHSCCSQHLSYMQRPYLVKTWLEHAILARMKEGGLPVTPPVLSRPFQLLSDGMIAFEQCRKLADTPFPFPWAQFVMVLLLLHSLLAPVMIVAYIPNLWLSILLSVGAVVTYWTLNEVARDMEDPFIYEPNELPLAKHQYDFNIALLAVAKAKRPRCNFEMDEEVVASCGTDYTSAGHSLQVASQCRSKGDVNNEVVVSVTSSADPVTEG